MAVALRTIDVGPSSVPAKTISVPAVVSCTTPHRSDVAAASWGKGGGLGGGAGGVMVLWTRSAVRSVLASARVPPVVAYASRVTKRDVILSKVSDRCFGG